jgi:hypothetical protein
MDWTETGAPPPTRTPPTEICRVLRRGKVAPAILVIDILPILKK